MKLSILAMIIDALNRPWLKVSAGFGGETTDVHNNVIIFIH